MRVIKIEPGRYTVTVERQEEQQLASYGKRHGLDVCHAMEDLLEYQLGRSVEIDED